MKKLFQKNLELFFKRFPHYEKKWEGELKSSESNEFEVRGDGDSLSLFEQGKLLDSESLPFPGLEERNAKNPGRVLLIENFGLGSLVRAVLCSSLQHFQNMIIVEPSPRRFLFALKHLELEKLLEDERIHFIVGATPDEIFSFFMQFLRTPEIAFRMDAYRILKHPVLSARHTEYFDVVWDEWLAAQKQIRLIFGRIDDSLLGLRYIAENIPWIENTPGILNLKEKFSGVPAIIVSTGPSLSKSIHELKELQHKALILAADASLSILLDHGIEPHFVLSLERDLWSMKFFVKSCREHPALKTNLIAYPMVPNESLRSFRGPQWVAYRDYGYFIYFEHSMPRGIISSSSSVAHFCVRLADFLGCSEAVLVGQDLAFDPDDFHTHAEGVAYEDWAKASSLDAIKERIQKEQLGELLWVEGNLRPKVPTHSVYFSFMKEMSWEASQVSLPVTNCTQGGAKLPKIQWRELGRASETWKESGDLFQRIAALREIPPGSLDPLYDVAPFLTELIDKFNTILSLTENPEIYGQLPPEKRFETIQVLRMAQTELFKDTRFVCFVLQNSGRELLEIENEWACLNGDADFGAQLQVLRKWTELVTQVALQVRDIVLFAASKKKIKSPGS